jgi:hypothetical protein
MREMQATNEFYGWLAIINGRNSVPASGRRYNAFILIKEVQTHTNSSGSFTAANDTLM